MKKTITKKNRTKEVKPPNTKMIITGKVLTILFPVIVVMALEINQKGNFVALRKLMFEDTFIFIFNVIFISIVFALLILIIKRIWISALIISVAMFSVSCVEYYRYDATGVHFTFYDFSVVTNLSDVMTYTTIEIGAVMISVFLFLSAYIIALYFSRFNIIMERKNKVPLICMTGIILATFIFSSDMAYNIFDAFGIKYGGINNTFVSKEKFENNGMTAFLVENVVDVVKTSTILKPQNLSEKEDEILSNPVKPTDINNNAPNVITIMSEAYADFREFPQLNISDKYYEGFDLFCDTGFKGTTAVPTFGGFTIKSEFELIFGLPIKSLNSTSTPQNIISSNKDEDKIFATVPRYYQSLGYETNYIHPYVETFYDRNENYTHVGFDNMTFQDAFDEDDYWNSYISDEATFDMAIEKIQSSHAPQYIHITTMQNHMPYTNNSSKSEIENYLDGIAKTSEALIKMFNDLSELDEPVMILFVGDHFPAINDENSVYDILNVNSSTSQQLYEQKYFVWNNYGLDVDMSDELISLFYLPYIVADKMGLVENQITSKIVEQSKKTPVYTKEIKDGNSNEILDILTYDIIFSDLSEKVYS